MGGNISAISIKTGKSIALPIYNKTREDLEEIACLHETTKKDAANEKKREISAQSEEDINTDRDQKKRKVDAASKSPLLKAIKTLKSRDEKNDEESMKTKEDLNTKVKKEKKKRKKKEASSS